MNQVGMALAVLLLAGQATAQGKFEGTVVYRMSMPGGQEMNVTMAQRGTRLRQEAQGPQGQTMASIIDSESGEMTMLMPAQKAYMSMNLKGMQEKMPAQVQEQTDPSRLKVTPTGKAETIAGVRCEGYTIEPQDGSKVEICAARGMGFLGGQSVLGMGPPGANPLEGNPALQRMAKDGFFPLRMVMRDGKGQTVSMVATRVDRTPPAAAQFTPPAGWTKMDIPAMHSPPGMAPGMAPGGPPASSKPR